LAGENAELLSEEGGELSVRTVERVLSEEGFAKLPRRMRLKLGQTVKDTEVPERAQVLCLADLDGRTFESLGAGVFLFAPFLVQLGFEDVVMTAGLLGFEVMPAASYVVSFLALKLLGTERYAHVGDQPFEPGLGPFAGLNVLPKCTAMSVYSYSVDTLHLRRFRDAFVRRGEALGLYDGGE
jgi:hypothetical protein